ncbi:hypothetical protein Tco_0790402 [Tanacetum coccineum]
MERARKQQVPKDTISSSDTVALEEFDQKTTLFETMTKSKSFTKSPKQRAFYHALMESIMEDEDVMDEGVANKLQKRKPYDADKDKGPSAGSNRGLKRQRISKDSVDDAEFDNTDMPIDQGEDLIKTDEQPTDEAVSKNDWYKKSGSGPDPE